MSTICVHKHLTTHALAAVACVARPKASLHTRVYQRPVAIHAPSTLPPAPSSQLAAFAGTTNLPQAPSGSPYFSSMFLPYTEIDASLCPPLSLEQRAAHAHAPLPPLKHSRSLLPVGTAIGAARGRRRGSRGTHRGFVWQGLGTPPNATRTLTTLFSYALPVHDH